MDEWTRIPAPIDSETDRRTLTAILTAIGLEVRIVMESISKSGGASVFKYPRWMRRGLTKKLCLAGGFW